ncbi:MAG TPA: helix-turn-helix domain-containing protein [Candidatus Limnocylindrales bacterium]|nr:helix-turn-helix domain-containing protein [Candidatus Limnocylindrales bacterium]
MARQQLRFGSRRLGRDRTPIDAAPAPPVGETLQLARERKGVDLYRAERDTKIRLRYLSALEDGDYDELPAPVYTKGFLRNYAIYLGLEPDDILDRWRDEMEQQRTATRVAVIPPPMPIVEPGGRRLHITPSMIVAGLVGLVVIAFVGYIGIQLLRFAEVTPNRVTNPADVFSQVDAASITIAGESGPGARVQITGPGDQAYDVIAHDDGTWTQEVNLARGQNDFTIVATDPVTGRASKAITITINVPLPSPSPGSSATPSAGPPITLTLSLTSPSDGLVSTDGVIVVAGTTTGGRINVTSTYLGTPDSTPAPSSSPSTPAPGSPGPTGTPAPIGPGGDVAPGIAGAFSRTFNFDPGRWQVTVVAYATDQVPVARQVTIVVQAPGPVTQHLQLTIENNAAFVRVLADGVRVQNGQLSVGTTRQYEASEQFCVRTANAGSVHLVLDALDLGLLGADGESGSWIVKSGLAPVRAARPC